MILLIHRKWAMSAAIFLLVSVSLLSLLEKPCTAIASADATLPLPETVILDAGHGGSDGGAVSADGTPESIINLAITLRLRDFFELMGYRCTLTRTGDASLADPESTTIRQEKVSDTKNRVALINGVPNARLISIHQNMLPGHPAVYGAQVFYGAAAGSEGCAASVQQALNTAVNIGNEKNCKAIDSDIYIMAHADCPSILVECGFLSNRSETALLLTPEYQTKLAVVIGCGYLQYCSGR